MDLIEIHLAGDRESFAPWEPITGAVSWRLDAPATGVEIRLFWYTRGKGTTDVQVVKAQHFAAPGGAGRRPFKFVLPEEPYSFSGKLISLIWALEAVVQPGERSARRELVVAPGGTEILLGTVETKK